MRHFQCFEGRDHNAYREAAGIATIMGQYAGQEIGARASILLLVVAVIVPVGSGDACYGGYPGQH